jgi:hypothetical protein
LELILFQFLAVKSNNCALVAENLGTSFALVANSMKATRIRNILIGIYVLLVLGFSALAKADVSKNVHGALSVEVSPFSR